MTRDARAIRCAVSGLAVVALFGTLLVVARPAGAAPPLSISLPSGVSVTAGQSISLPNVEVTDAAGTTDSTTNGLTVVLKASGGTLAMSTTTGLQFAPTAPNDSRVVSFHATTAAANEALTTLRFQSPSTQAGSVTLTGEVMDGRLRYDITSGHFYEFVSSPEDAWESAKAAAAARVNNGMQGYLATITSASEQATVGALTPGGAFVGGTDAGTEGTTEGRWIWADGPEAGQEFWLPTGATEPARYTNWGPFEPSNSEGTEHYLGLFSDGRWNDYPTSAGTITGYVVEYGGRNGDTTPAWPGALRYGADTGHFYELIESQSAITWTAANAAAQGRTVNALNGYLVTSTSTAEQNFLTGGPAFSAVWLGATDDPAYGTTEGNWIWAGGPEAGLRFWTPTGPTSPAQFQRWSGGQPDNAGGAEHYLEHAPALGGWNDHRNSAGIDRYVVEYGSAAIPLAPGGAAVNVTTVATVPDAPTGLTATPRDTRVTLAWNAPPQNGSPITGYTVAYRPAGTNDPFTTRSTGRTPSREIAGLVNGLAYEFQVAASNSSGLGAYSGLVTSTPGPFVPSADQASFTTARDTPTPISGLSVQDPAGSTSSTLGVQIVLETSAGTFTFGSTPGLTFRHGGATGSSVVVATGTITAVNAALDTLSVVPPNGFAGVIDVTLRAVEPALWFFPSTGHFYEKFDEGSGTTWAGARDRAASLVAGSALRGYLATITSAQEQAFLDSIPNPTGSNAFIGATDAVAEGATEGRWRWVTGPEAATEFFVEGSGPLNSAYSNWEGGEPNNFSGSQHYAVAYTSGRWDDAFANSQYSMLYVEYGGLSGDTALASANVTVDVVADVPSAPTGLTATPGDRSLILDWDPPTDNGGSAVTGYTVSYRPQGSSADTVVNTASETITLTGLAGGTPYDIAVQAVSDAGAGTAATTTAAPLTPTVTVSTSTPSVNEGATVSFTVASSISLSSDLVVAYSVGGTVSPGDYMPVSGTVTLPSGNNASIVVITTIDDALVERSETLILAAQSGGDHTVGSPSSAESTIASEDVPVVSVQQRTTTVSKSSGTVAFDLVLDQAPVSPLTVFYSVSGAPVSGNQSLSGSSVTFAPGETTKTVAVTLAPDTAFSPPQPLTFVVTGATGGAVGAQDEANVTVVSNVTEPKIAPPDEAPQAGGPLVIRGQGFEPLSRVEIFLGSRGVLLGVVLADDAGFFEARVQLPSSASGRVDVVASGTAIGGAPLTLTQAVDVAAGPTSTGTTITASQPRDRIPETGGNPSAAVTLGSALLILGMVSLAARLRTRGSAMPVSRRFRGQSIQ